MDYNNFRAAAYLKNSGNGQEKKDNNSGAGKNDFQQGQILRNGDSKHSPKTVKPVSFERVSRSEMEGKSGGNSGSSSGFKPGFPFGAYAGSSVSSGSQGAGRSSGVVNKVQDFSNNGGNSAYGARNYGAENDFSRKPVENVAFKKETKKEAARRSASQQLENVTNYLKSGGLLKVPVKGTLPDGKESVYRRVAKFIILIGVDEASTILPFLSENQIERILAEIASIRTISKEEASVILEEFHSYVKKVKTQGGIETAREMLVKAYGPKRAEEMLKKAIPVENVEPFSYLNDLDDERIYLLLKDENVGVQAIALSHIEPKKSAAVINQMDDDEKSAVILRLAKMEPISPEVLRRVDQAMHEKSLSQTVEETENIDGRNALAQILKKMDSRSENEILDSLSYEDPDLGRDLRNRLFTIDDVVNADDRFIQNKLREMTEEEICYLVAGKPSDFKEKILGNISANRRAEVYEQDKILTVKRRSDCDKITSQFMAKLRVAFEEGDLIIHNRNDEQFV